MKIVVQTEDFDVQKEYAELKANPHAGAVVMFVGNVRDINEGLPIEKMSLEHYALEIWKLMTKLYSLEFPEATEESASMRVNSLSITLKQRPLFGKRKQSTARVNGLMQETVTQRR